jgi:predicted pyridoxine 5'-phosphate oxidase superfamily flavin-nucleotide-binding protein
MMSVLAPEAQRVVEEQRLGFVATVNDDGTPNLSPKGTLAVLDGDHLMFANIRSPRTIHNLRQRPAIEINVVDPIGRQGYRFRGTATVVDPGEEYDRLMAIYGERASEYPVLSVVVIRVERAEPVISPAYDLGQTEPEIRARWRAHFAALDASRTE